MRDVAMPVLRILALIAGAVVTSGCHCGCLMKRESEANCPTDIRQTVPWCGGEDAIFHCPCRPACEFYGYKPTCWGIWPASGAEWRDAYCGSPMCDYTGQRIDAGPEFILPERGLMPEEILKGQPTLHPSEPLPTSGAMMPGSRQLQPARIPTRSEPKCSLLPPTNGTLPANPFRT